jgi:phosphoribosyl-ATP pyrophosphohydrolase
MTLNQSQLVARHHAEQFGQVDLTRLAAKLGEETGETIGAVIRHTEQRDGRSWEPEIKSELMDVLTVAHVLAARIGCNLCDLSDSAAVRFTSRLFTNVQKIDAPNKETNT